MSNHFYILPNTLFSREILEKTLSSLEYDRIRIIMWEHPHFFTRYNFNKKKLLLHRASMKMYLDTVLGKINKKKYVIEGIDYVECKEKHRINAVSIEYDPIDEIQDYNLKEYIESPNFLLTKSEYLKYRKNRDKDKGFRFTTGFYKYGKRCIKFLTDVDSQDKMNRDAMKEIDIKRIPKYKGTYTKKELKYIDEAKEYCEQQFTNNPGCVDDFNYPINHKSAKKMLLFFLTKKIERFGDFQDAIVQNENLLYHSMLSSSLNIGLVNPDEIISMLKERTTNKIPMNSLEGYVRQLFWREFQRYCFIHAKPLLDKNYFDYTPKKIHFVTWYNPDEENITGILPVDDCIKKAMRDGYLHHIERLMVIGNYMVLSNICPMEGYKWFMEFAIDSYDWVMCQNVYDMVFFRSGGKTTSKPYISSSNYLLKMSNYPKAIWAKKWDTLYDDFLQENKKKLYKFRYHFPKIKTA